MLSFASLGWNNEGFPSRIDAKKETNWPMQGNRTKLRWSRQATGAD